VIDDPRYPNPIRAAQRRADEAEGAAEFWRCMTGLLCVCVIGMGVVLGLIAHEHDTAVKARVEQTVVLPRQ
jgi:hypothetical protein